MNPFSLSLQREVMESIKRLEQTEDFTQGQNNHDLLTERDKYTSRIFRIQSALRNTSEQLFHIKIFLNRYPFRKHYLEQGISQLEYIQYHTEALYHKVHTVLEIMRLMVNEVYQLNIPLKDCSWLKLKKKLSVTERPMECLTQYFDVFRNLIDLRHLNSHRGYYEDEEKDKIDLNFGLFFYKEEHNGYRIDEDLKRHIPLPLINYMLKEHKSKRVKLVEEIIWLNEKYLTEFLSSLAIEYERQRLSLSDRPRK